MTYTKITQDRLKKSFDKIYEYLKQSDEKHLMKDIMVRAEILKRDFTKRQQNIIWFIFTLSTAYAKEFALIPQTSDFELCGVSKNKVRQELDKLEEMNVVECEKTEKNLYRILPPIEWKAPYHRMYSDTRSRELFVMNAEHANIDFDFKTLD